MVPDVDYVVTSDGSLRFDIVRPASPLPHMPVVIFIHGGGFATALRQ